jgi:FkbM family methyltransferase
VGKIPGVRSLADRLYPRRPEVFALPKPLEGHRMRLHWKSRKGIVFGTWEPEVVEVIERVVCPGQLAVDVGGHVGYFTLLLAKQVGPLGQVVAFEPNPEIFETLKENVALNGYGNVTLEKKAVADRPGEVELMLSSGSPFEGIDSIISDPGPGRRIRVPTVTLDDYFAHISRPVGFVKIDIEGAETLALSGMSRILNHDRPPVVVELHGLVGRPETHPALFKLEAAGYGVSVLDVAGTRAHVLAEPKHTDG